VALGVLESLSGEDGREAMKSEVARVAILMVGGQPWSTAARRWRPWTSLMPVA